MSMRSFWARGDKVQVYSKLTIMPPSNYFNLHNTAIINFSGNSQFNFKNTQVETSRSK